MGRKKLPFYRLVAIDARKRREGLEIERLGWYNPVPNEFSCDLNEDRILHWLNQGAQPSETVDGLFRRMGLKYKWHLIQQGTKDNEIEKLLEEWKKNQAKKAYNRLLNRFTNHHKDYKIDQEILTNQYKDINISLL